MKVHSNSIEEHAEVPLPDAGRFEALVEHWTRFEVAQEPTSADANACYVVSVHQGQEVDGGAGQLAEIVSLVQTRGDAVVGSESYELDVPEPRTLLRKGAAQRVAAAAKERNANLLVLDADLTPSQMRNLEDCTGLAVCDREAVILDVFERHAKSRRSRLQIAIAHLEYLRPRIRGIGLNMDQQAGGIMGSRGPGETASEILARRLDTRLAQMRRQLRQLAVGDAAARKHREGAERIALVGYTNAGKTSLMNALTGAGLSARNRPFETLEATSRCLSRHGGDVLISDTVGFIRKLPDRLLASFESTLAEAAEATLLLLVVDISDAQWPLHVETTLDVLSRLRADTLPRFFVFNKADQASRLPDFVELQRVVRGAPYRVLSARDDGAVAELQQALLQTVRASHERRKLFVPYEWTDVTAALYARCRVLDARACDNGVRFIVEASEVAIAPVMALMKRRNV